MAVALGVKAVEAGYSVLFLTLENLMTRLVKAQSETGWNRTLNCWAILNCSSLTRLAIYPSRASKPAYFSG